jgi:predicted adenine nucleotide alpha hydrolase (AANH) superfamily ATPase
MRGGGHKTAGFFYNPNIHPYSEYLKRMEEVDKYSKSISLNVIYSDYDIEEYFQHIVYNEAMKNRCPVCWWLRMAKTAKFAKENGFDSFTTTLLGSPYQDESLIKNICEDVGRKTGIGFYCADFKSGFKKAHDTARSKGMYCQNYCGCIFSEKEKVGKRLQRDKDKVSAGDPQNAKRMRHLTQ